MHIDITPSLERRFWAKVDRTGDCWLWTGARDEDGYGYIMAGAKSLGGRRAPRVSWTLHYGPIPDGLWVMHKCDNPPCVRPDHLRLGNPKENMDDMWAKGRARPCNPNPVRGEIQHAAKLTAANVIEMRRLHELGWTTVALAAQFSVSQAAAWYVVRRLTWKHIA